MIWNFIVIGAAVIIFIILIRRIPLAREIQEEESPEVSDEEMTTYGLISQADDAFDQKNFEEAEKFYIKAVSQDPTNAKIYSKLGAIYLEQKNFYDAKDSFLQALKLDPDIASRHVNLGLAYMGLKDYYKSIQEFEEALEQDPKNRKYQSLLDKAEKAKVREENRIKK
jgi:tetratricopeptide (TPR) repeat protein